jgi:hypothetical protein
VSLVLPTGDATRGRGNGSVGWDFNLPLSKQFRDLYFTGTRASLFCRQQKQKEFPDVQPGGATDCRQRHLARAADVQLDARECLVWPEEVVGTATERTYATIVIPGFRTGWNVGDAQARRPASACR